VLRLTRVPVPDDRALLPAVAVSAAASALRRINPVRGEKSFLNMKEQKNTSANGGAHVIVSKKYSKSFLLYSCIETVA